MLDIRNMYCKLKTVGFYLKFKKIRICREPIRNFLFIVDQLVT